MEYLKNIIYRRNLVEKIYKKRRNEIGIKMHLNTFYEDKEAILFQIFREGRSCMFFLAVMQSSKQKNHRSHQGNSWCFHLPWFNFPAILKMNKEM
jgi:hypothetical protein